MAQMAGKKFRGMWTGLRIKQIQVVTYNPVDKTNKRQSNIKRKNTENERT